MLQTLQLGSIGAALAVLLLCNGIWASPVSIGPHSLSTRQQLLDMPQNATAVLKRNCAYWGWYPDDGDKEYGSQGTLQTLAQLNAAAGTPAFAVGAYAHIDQDDYNPYDPSTHFNGSEILPYIEQALAANATFVASISPVHGYGGFQINDTTNALATVNVLRDFVNAGVEVWLRWGHEFNWYTRYGSDDHDPARKRKYYAGGAKEFVDAWKVTYDVVRAALPTVKFMWCANVGEMSELRPFWPGEDYVDIVALDYYTLLGVSKNTYTYVDTLIQQTHDTFALPYNKPFWLGETGTRSNDTEDNLQWIDTITSEAACEAMPNYEGAFWFNYVKNDLDHRVVQVDGSAPTNAFVELMTGAPAPNPLTLNTTGTSLAPGFQRVVSHVQGS